MAKSLLSLYQKRGFWYLDARRHGGGRIALVPEGATAATQDRATAERLAAAIVARLQGERLTSARLGLNPTLALRVYGPRSIDAAEANGEASADWLKVARDYLANALHFFESVQPATATTAAERRRMAAPRNMAAISAPDVAAFQAWLRQQPNGRRGGTYGPQTVRHHCSVLSRIYARAIREGQLQSNPVSAAGLPSVPHTDTPLLEAEEVALALEAARLIEAEAVASEAARRSKWEAERLRGAGKVTDSFEPALNAQRMVHVALAVLAYTGTRSDEAERLEWPDLLEGAGGTLARVHSAQKGRGGIRRGRAIRLVPLSPYVVAILAAWRRRAGAVAGRILADPDTGAMPDLRKAFAAVERRAGLPAGVLGSRAMRVAYATHRATCDGVTWNDVRDELGHADLSMQGRVYGRGRMNREPMGEHLDYRWERWGGRAAALQANTPSRWDVGRAERERTVRDFLEATAGMGLKAAAGASGVSRAAIQRLRSGKAADVKGATLARMRGFLEGRARAVA